VVKQKRRRVGLPSIKEGEDTEVQEPRPPKLELADTGKTDQSDKAKDREVGDGEAQDLMTGGLLVEGSIIDGLMAEDSEAENLEAEDRKVEIVRQTMEDIMPFIVECPMS
jgi:hypothetical protein